MDEKILILLEEINQKIDRNYDVTLEGIAKHEEDINVLNDKLDDIIMLLLKRSGRINLKEILKSKI